MLIINRVGLELSINQLSSRPTSKLPSLFSFAEPQFLHL